MRAVGAIGVIASRALPPALRAPQAVAAYRRPRLEARPAFRFGAALRAAASGSSLVGEMAPTGKLRVAINMRNPLLVTGRTADGDPEGLAPSMAAAFAEKLGVPVEYVHYPDAGAISADAAEDNWDVAMIGADPARADHVKFTNPYCQIEATYAVPNDSAAQKCADIDKVGTSVASVAGGAYTLWLERNLKKATLVAVDGHDPTYEEFNNSKLEALAGLRPKLTKDVMKRPGTRLLGDKFMAVEQAACTKKGRDAGFQALADFIEEAKASGLVKDLMAKFKVDQDLVVP